MLDAHDWDKHSSSSLSEVSVACLQDRIMQMEETHYRFVFNWVSYCIVLYCIVTYEGRIQ